MVLRQGITGFRHVDDPDLPVCDLTTFRTHCHHAARMIDGRVLRYGHRSNRVEANFAQAVLEIPQGQIAVLLNCHFPVIGFAVPIGDADTGPLSFLDCEELGQILQSAGEYEVLSRNELERAVSQSELQKLLPAETEQAKYWRPRRIGDVVFNFWD